MTYKKPTDDQLNEMLIKHQYILKYRKPVPVKNYKEVTKQMKNRHFKRVRFTSRNGVNIVTSFLGIDHNVFGTPALFETFNITTSEVLSRACTHRQALNQHWDAVAQECK